MGPTVQPRRWLVGGLLLVLCSVVPGSLRAQPSAAPQDTSPRPGTVFPAAEPPAPEPPLSQPIPLSPPRPLAGSLAVSSPLAANLWVDLPVVLGLGSVLLGLELSAPQLPPPSCGPVCDPQTVNGFDRVSIGWHSQPARTASNVLIGVNIALPFVLDLLDVAANRPPDAVRGYLQDVLILSEVFVVNAGINTLFKYAARRPRPLLYDADLAAVPLEDRQDSDAGLSFYSQHSSSAFAMATAGSYLFMLRHPRSKWVIPVWLFSEALAATTASMRVLAGKHFISDVLVGAVMGSAVGLLIPYLHRRALPQVLAQKAGPLGRSLRISAAPLFMSDGGGLLVSFLTVPRGTGAR